MIEKYGIWKRKEILNMNESSARVVCPKREEVIVLIHVKELYSLGPEDRKSVTIIERYAEVYTPTCNRTRK
jgi:hypothetical protein